MLKTHIEQLNYPNGIKACNVFDITHGRVALATFYGHDRHDHAKHFVTCLEQQVAQREKLADVLVEAGRLLASSKPEHVIVKELDDEDQHRRTVDTDIKRYSVLPTEPEKRKRGRPRHSPRP